MPVIYASHRMFDSPGTVSVVFELPRNEGAAAAETGFRHRHT